MRNAMMKSVVLSSCFVLIASVPHAGAHDSAPAPQAGCEFSKAKVDVQEQTPRDCCAARLCC